MSTQMDYLYPFSACYSMIAVHSFAGKAPGKFLLSRGRVVCQSVKCFFF